MNGEPPLRRLLATKKWERCAPRFQHEEADPCRSRRSIPTRGIAPIEDPTCAAGVKRLGYLDCLPGRRYSPTPKALGGWLEGHVWPLRAGRSDRDGGALAECDHHPVPDSLSIPARFNGPLDSGNGGYCAGLVAGLVEGPAEVNLRRPVPLDAERLVRARRAWQRAATGGGARLPDLLRRLCRIGGAVGRRSGSRGGGCASGGAARRLAGRVALPDLTLRPRSRPGTP